MKNYSPLPSSIYYLIFAFSFLSSCGSSSLLHERIQTQEKCDCKADAYWYNNKCWKNYEPDWQTVDNVDSLVEAEIAEAEKIRIKVGESEHPINAFIPMPSGDGYAIIVEYTDNDGRKTMISQVSRKEMYKKDGNATVDVYHGSALNDDIALFPFAKGSMILNLSENEEELRARGYITKKKSEDSAAYSFLANESISGLGDTQLEIVGDEAFLSGTLGSKAYAQIKDLIENHPTVTTLVLKSVPGSINDEINMHTGRLIHEAKLTTKVLEDSEIASGGVDLFCAGENRIVEKGAKIGIHSWCCYDDIVASDLPKDHPAHEAQINYFTLIMGKENGMAFYFRTIEAAAFDTVHWMSDEEIKKWKVSTEFIGE